MPALLARIPARLRTPQFLSVVAVVATVLLANAVFVLGLRSNDPLLYHSGLGSPRPGVNGLTMAYAHGAHTIDANDGWTAQSLGHLAARMWLDGHVPLWNPYEGLGQPLAGEMQSAAFFLPFVLLQLLPNGILWMHIALELVAGLGTLAFLRQLRLSWVAATVGGCLFAVNGAFSVMTNAPFNPIAFLPVALYGVELIRSAAERGQRSRRGLWVTAWAVAMMLFAGFPETAYLQGLFVATWAIVRLCTASRPARLRFAGHVVGSAVVGLLLAAPVLAAFVHFLDFGYVSYHDTAVNNLSYARPWFFTLGMKYVGGQLYQTDLGASQAGYVTLATLGFAALAVLGARRARLRPERVVVLLVLLTGVANMYGFRPVKIVLNLVPGMSGILGYKYGLVLVEFSAILLAALGIDDLRRGASRRRIAAAAAVVVAYAGGGVGYLHHLNLLHRPRWTAVFVGGALVALVAAAALLVVGRSGPRRRLLAGVGGALLILDGCVVYAIPQLSTSPPVAVDLAPVRYLQQHLGTSRFYTLGPIQPNYGSYFGIAQLNINDLPVAQRYSTYLTEHLQPKPGTPGAKGTKRAFLPYELSPLNPPVTMQKRLLVAYGQQQHWFRAAAVEYLVTAPGVVDAPAAQRYGLTRVFRDHKAEIWRDAHAVPYYSGSGCRVERQSYTAVTVDCAAATTLHRVALATPGWRASIDAAGGGRNVTVPVEASYFQQVGVPAGRSTVTFDYRPPSFGVATAVSLLTIGAMFADNSLGWARRRRKHRKIGVNVTPRD